MCLDLDYRVSRSSSRRLTLVFTAFCGAVFDTNTCKVVDGQLRIYIAPKVDPAIASYKVRIAIRNYLNSIHQLDGLYATTYVAPDIINPADDNNNANANGGDNPNANGADTPLFTASSDNTEQLSSRSIIRIGESFCNKIQLKL